MTTGDRIVAAFAALSVAAWATAATLATQHHNGWAALASTAGALLAITAMATILITARPPRHRSHP